MGSKKLKARLFLRGYFGPNNIGDDVLMLVSSKIAAGCLRGDEIYVGVQNPNVARSLFPRVQYVKPEEYDEINVETLIFAGGGQFYSFPETVLNPFPNRNRLSRLVKGKIGLPDAVRFLKRKLSNKQRIKARKSGAFCVGIGPFVPGSLEEINAKAIMKKCGLISVRDRASKSFLDKWRISPANVYTDATFLNELWTESPSVPEDRAPLGAAAFIFRHWPHTKEGALHLEAMKNAAARLRSDGWRIRFVSLAKKDDEQEIATFTKEDILVWDPESSSPGKFLKNIADSFDIVVSTRAHGVLLPAMMGLPGICVALEPKLKNIHNMLSQGSQLWLPPFDERALCGQVNEISKNLCFYRSMLKKDVAFNQILAQKAKTELETFLTEIQ